MTENGAAKKRSPMRKLSTLLILVLFVFGILLVSFVIAGFIIFLLLQSGMIAPVGERNFYSILLFLLLVSLGIATIISAVGGTFFLRPLRRLIGATKAVAAGNFDVYVEPSGPYEMQRLTSSFNDMTRDLGSIETLRSDFVSNVSHEFKTPVASIRGFARLLKRGTLTSAQHDEYLDIILLEAERLSQLSSNVLLLSNLDSTDHLPDTAAFSLDEQLRQTVLLLQPQLEKKGLQVELDCEAIQLVGSEELLKQVWLNLMGNAIKFTPEGGEIHISAASTGPTATVTITDSGIGMEENVQQHLFDKFYQGDASRSTQGNGLGLPLAQRIVALSGGTIHASSQSGAGAAFTVVLPKTPVPAHM